MSQPILSIPSYGREERNEMTPPSCISYDLQQPEMEDKQDSEEYEMEDDNSNEIKQLVCGLIQLRKSGDIRTGQAHHHHEDEVSSHTESEDGYESKEEIIETEEEEEDQEDDEYRCQEELEEYEEEEIKDEILSIHPPIHNPIEFIPQEFYGYKTTTEGAFRCLHTCKCSYASDWVSKQKGNAIVHMCNNEKHTECNNQCHMFQVNKSHFKKARILSRPSVPQQQPPPSTTKSSSMSAVTVNESQSHLNNLRKLLTSMKQEQTLTCFHDSTCKCLYQQRHDGTFSADYASQENKWIKHLFAETMHSKCACCIRSISQDEFRDLWEEIKNNNSDHSIISSSQSTSTKRKREEEEYNYELLEMEESGKIYVKRKVTTLADLTSQVEAQKKEIALLVQNKQELTRINKELNHQLELQDQNMTVLREKYFKAIERQH